MKYLLDTHIYLWWLDNDKRLTASMMSIIDNSDNFILVSVISFWEISIKNRIGKLPLKTPFNSLYTNLQFRLLSVDIEHVLVLDKLPLLHNDPFDRMLIAQAEAEKCVLITDDEQIKKYHIKTIE